MSWDIWDPFEDMKNMQKDMEKTFRDFFRKPARLAKQKLAREPLVDISETKKDVTAKIELPGIDKKDIDLNVTENMLAVKAEKKAEKEKKGKSFFRKERSYTCFQRAFSLPAKVKAEQAKADFKDGLLKVTVPKQKPEKKKKKKAKKVIIK